MTHTSSLVERFEEEVFVPYIELLRSEYRFHDRFSQAKAAWEQQLTFGALTRGPYIEGAHLYADGRPLADLGLAPTSLAALDAKMGARRPYQHQSQAIEMLLGGENALVTTGTSSGKTLCYQVPILDDLVHNPGPGVRAIIIYPLNALANDQIADWNELLSGTDITFARFTGQTPNDQKEYEQLLFEEIASGEDDLGLSANERSRRIQARVRSRLADDEGRHKNRLNHREAIRGNPPNILITNFSMLEYLLERPIDASVFDGSRLHFLVLDEVHSYRGIQSTEIAFLIRRLKSRLGIDELRCIATSATLGQSDEPSRVQARRFASDLFGEPFDEPNPLRGEPKPVILEEPSIRPDPVDYIAAFTAASTLLTTEDREKHEAAADLAAARRLAPGATTLSEVLARDANVYDLRSRYLSGPRLLADAASDLWPSAPDGPAGLTALLGLVAWEGRERDLPLLPARQHYFVRSMEGLFVCLRTDCPARSGDQPAWFVTRTHEFVADGECPSCAELGHPSRLVETVGCRTCGYLFGALQDRGPKEQARGEAGDQNTPFDSFATDLGEDNEAFRSYFTVEGDLPWPGGVSGDDEEDDADEGLATTESRTMPWCAACGLRVAQGEGGACKCAPSERHARSIRVVHRQCEMDPDDRRKTEVNLRRRRLMRECPNCHYKRVSVEPVQRYREWRDEMGAAMAMPLSYFQMRPTEERKSSKLLCFTDNRQRAAAFPTLLEERSFPNDFGRALLSLLRDRGAPMAIEDLGQELEVMADDPARRLFLPPSRLPDGVADQRAVRNAWNAEVMAHFASMDAAGRTPEDLGLLSVRYRLETDWMERPRTRLAEFGLDATEADEVIQVLLAFLRRDKAVTMPAGVDHDAPAFGSIPWKFVYALTTGEKREGLTVRGWTRNAERQKRFGATRVGDYLARVLGLPAEELFDLAEGIWDDLCEAHVLVRMNLGDFYQVDHEGLIAAVVEPGSRFVCDRCHTVTTLAPCAVCPRLGCPGTLRQRDWDAGAQTLVARWVSGDDQRFAAVRVAEHTAQIAKSGAEQIERAFRAEDTRGRLGVDVLSSTTTFEMGINIGDLQTVLLRNAPRSSANYVQRVGRAGRGRDKNAICVTLCDRTPYAVDVWERPELIMGGEVRAPTVFLRNALIAQRHFNAYLFADFLRQRILVEKAVARPRQSLEICNFLPKNGLSFIYQNWLPEQRSRVPLDFAAWLDEWDAVVEHPMEAIVTAIGGVATGIQNARAAYEATVCAIDDEIDIYMLKRLENASTGKPTAGLERTVKNILRENAIDLMARGGFLPRYAFPLDVVALETEDSRWTRSDVVLQRDRALAIVEYAPGSTVVANKKSFKSEGLYIATNRDQPKVMHYSSCPDCQRVLVYLVKPDFGEDGPPVCECGHRGIKPRQFIEPRAFSVGPDSRKEGRFTRYRRGMSDRQIQSSVSFIDAIPDGDYEPAGAFDLGFKPDGKLFRSNSGPGGKGFAFCGLCGWGLPESEVTKNPLKSHPSLRAWGAKERTCEGGLGIRFTSLGHRFTSLCLSVRPVSGFDEGLSISMAAALQRGICEVLGIDMSDIGVVLQRLPDRIVFYDNTAGGAGFVLEAKDRWSEVEDRALKVARDCICEDACHRCLKHFGNQFVYASLDRQRVVAYLESSRVAVG